MAENEQPRKSSLADRARSALSTVREDERVRQAEALTKDAASRAQEASKNVQRKVGQQDAWDELRGDAELLTEIVRAQHALITDLIGRVTALEARTETETGAGRGR